jgi:hypothetical protein
MAIDGTPAELGIRALRQVASHPVTDVGTATAEEAGAPTAAAPAGAEPDDAAATERHGPAENANGGGSTAP